MNRPTTVYEPGTATESDEYPDEVRWTFSVEVGGQAGTSSMYFPIGTSQETAARLIHEMLEADPLEIEGVPASHTGGGGGGDSSTTGPATSGSGDGPTNPVKMKAADEEDDDFGL